MSKKLKNGIGILVGQAVFKEGSKQSKYFLTDNSITACPTHILMLFLSSLDHLLAQNMHILFFKTVLIILR